MKNVTYYCGEEFDPTGGKHLTAEDWLVNKIDHASKLHRELAHKSYLDRDDLRIKRIASAIGDWNSQLAEINGHSKGIE